MPHRIAQPEGWRRPRGYSNGMAGRGEFLAIAGQGRDRRLGEIARLYLDAGSDIVTTNTFASIPMKKTPTCC